MIDHTKFLKKINKLVYLARRYKLNQGRGAPFMFNHKPADLKEDCKFFQLIDLRDPGFRGPYGHRFPYCTQEEHFIQHLDTGCNLTNCKDCPFYEPKKID